MKLLRKRNLLCLCLFFAFLCGELQTLCGVKAAGLPNSRVLERAEEVVPNGLYSYASCLMDAENDRVLFERHGSEQLPMASTTKIMTLIVILEHASMDDIVTISKNAAAQPDVQLNIREGEKYRLGDLVYSLMLESHNDVAVALAEHVGGSVEEFALLMNAKAATMGLTNTNFVTPNGLDADGHYTTAIELSKIASYAIKNPDFLKITNTANYQFSELTTGRSFSVTNKNRFLYLMDGAIGVKTGFTGKAGYCFVGALKKGDHTLIATMLACGWPPNKTYKWSDTKKLMEYGLTHFKKIPFAEYATLSINGKEEDNRSFDPQKMQIVLPVTGGIAQSVEAAVDELALAPLLLAEWEEPEIEIVYEKELIAPVAASQVVGSVTCTIDEAEYASCFIRTKEAVPKIDFWYCLYRVIGKWKSGDF